MGKSLLSVGLDVGTTSTQLIVSRLTAENRASSFTVPKMEITEREILYRSPVHFTPLVSNELVDGAALRQLVEKEYEAAGITRESVDTGFTINFRENLILCLPGRKWLFLLMGVSGINARFVSVRRKQMRSSGMINCRRMWNAI